VIFAAWRSPRRADATGGPRPRQREFPLDEFITRGFTDLDAKIEAIQRRAEQLEHEVRKDPLPPG